MSEQNQARMKRQKEIDSTLDEVQMIRRIHVLHRTETNDSLQERSA
jgi:hypothetical protein